MAWRRSGDKPLSDPMLVSLPTHICVTRPQWVKQWRAGLKWIWHSLCPSWYTLLRARSRPANTNTGKPSCYPADQHVWFPSWLTSLYTSRCPRQGPSTTPEGPCCRQWTSRRRPGLRSCRHRGLHNMSQTAGITMSLRECVLWLLRSSPEVRWKRRKFSRYSLSISHGSLPNYSQQTPDIHMIYGISLGSSESDQHKCFKVAGICVLYRVIYDRDISRA